MAEKITISAPFSQESRSLGRIGRVGENLSRQIVFDCTSALTDRPNATIVCVIQRPGDKEPYAAQMTRVGDTGSYKLVLTSTEVAKSGSVRFELRMVDGEEILKAAIYTGTVEASMSGIGDTPGEPIPDALNRLETAISEVGKYADLKEEVETLQTSGTSTAEVADTNAVSIHGADGVYDLSKGTIQARLNDLEAGEALNVTKKRIAYSTIRGASSSISIPEMTISAQSTILYNTDITIEPDTGVTFDNLCYYVVSNGALNNGGPPTPPVYYCFAPSYCSATEIHGNLVIVNATTVQINIKKEQLQVYVLRPESTDIVTDVSGNVISGGSGDVTKSYVDSQDAALDAKITAAINAADANGVSIHGEGAAYDNTKGTIAARLEALEAGGGTSSTKIANGTGMAQVGPGKELVVDYSATGFTSAPVVVASHCQTGDSDTDTSGIVKVLSVTKTGCKISIIGGTADHDYPVSWIATGT